MPVTGNEFRQTFIASIGNMKNYGTKPSGEVLYRQRPPKTLVFQVIFRAILDFLGGAGIQTLLPILVVGVVVVSMKQHRLDIIEDDTHELLEIENLKSSLDTAGGSLASPCHHDHAIGQAHEYARI